MTELRSNLAWGLIVLSLAARAEALGPLVTDVRVNDPALDVLGDHTTQSETTLAVRGSTVCAGYNNTRAGTFPAPLAGVARSGDWGGNWADLDVASPLQGADPVLAVHEATGRFYYASIAALGGTGPSETLRGIIGVSTSTDDCQTFSAIPAVASPSVLLDAASVCVPGGVVPCSTNSQCAPGQVCSNEDFQDKPWIAVDNTAGPGDGNVYTCWNNLIGDHVGPSPAWEIRFSRSLNQGVGFQDEQVLSPVGDSYPFGCSVTVGPNGEVYVVWGTQNANRPIHFRRSVDRGASFGPVVQVNTSTIRAAGVDRLVGCGSSGTRPTLNGDVRMLPAAAWMAVDTTGGPYTGNLYVVWNAAPNPPPAEADDDQADVWFTRSTDGGQHWEPEVQIGGATISDQFMPNLAVGGSGTVSIAWYDRRNDGANLASELYRAVSRDGGKHFDPIRRTSDGSFPVPPIIGQPTSSGNFDAARSACYMGDYIAVAADGEHFYYSWGDNRNTLATAAYPGGRPDPDVYFDRVPVPAIAGSISGGTWAPMQLGGGRLSAVALGGGNPNRVYAGASYGGVFASDDAGATWSDRSAGLTNRDVRALVADPTAADIAYAGTSGHGVFKTTDGGQTWINASSGLTDTLVNSLAIDPTDGSKLFGGTAAGAFRSIDGGASWNLVASGPSTVYHAFAVAPASNQVAYAGYESASGGGVLKSIDGGASWSPADTGLPVGPFFVVYSLAVDPTDEDVVYAGTSAGPYKTIDGGGNWTQIISGLAYLHIFEAWAIDPSNPSVVYAGSFDAGVFKTTNGGGLWSAASTGLGEQSVLGLAIHPGNPNTLYAATDGNGVYWSINAASIWDPTNAGLHADEVNDVATAPGVADVVWAVTGFGGAFFSDDGGNSFVTRNDGLSNLYLTAIAVDPATPTTLYAGGAGVFKTVDAGVLWTQVDTGFGGYRIAIDPNDSNVIYVGSAGGGVQKSIDAGATWNPANSGLPGVLVRDIAIDESDSQIVYAATDNGLYKSTDGAANWTASLLGQVRSLAIHPVDTATVYAGTAAGVFKSIDGGANWNGAGTELNLAVIESLLIDPRNANVVYAGTSYGMYMTINGGSSWTALNAGLNRGPGALFPVALAIDPLDHQRVYAATFGGGAFGLRPTCGESPSSTCTGSGGPSGSCDFTFLPFASGVQINGSLEFDPGNVDVFGTLVDLGATVGAMSVAGSVGNNTGAKSPFTMSATDASLTLNIGGSLVCAPAGCLSGEPLFMSGQATVASGSVLPVGPQYRFEAALRHEGNYHWRGPCGLNAFLPVNTPEGTNVNVATVTQAVTCGQSSYDQRIEVTFANVSAPGSTLIVSTCDEPDSVPANLSLRLGPPGSAFRLFFDVSTTATYSPPITVCFDYPPLLGAAASAFKMLHEEGGEFVELPTTVDLVNHTVCGEVTSLSPFAIAEQGAPDTGLVPPDAASRRCEAKVLKRVAVLGKKLAACRVASANAAFAGRPYDLVGCEARARSKFDQALAGLTGCPLCVDGPRSVLREQVSTLVDGAMGGAYCAGTTPLAGTSLGYVPPDAAAKRCGAAVATQAAKLAKKIAICHVRAGNAAAASRPFDRADCEERALASYDNAIGNLAGCPSCATASGSALRNHMQTFGDDAATAVYCAGTTTVP